MITDAMARSLLYPAPPIPVSSPPEGLEEVELSLATGDTVVAWAGDGSEPEAPAVLFFHGNGENLETMRMAGSLENMRELGVAMLAVDYPGYGRSSGTPSEEGLEATADAALEWVRNRWPERSVVPTGWSLGAATAVGLAARAGESIRALVAMSVWTRLEEAAKHLFPAPLVKLLLSESYDCLAAAEKIGAPSLVIHGEQDRLIPVEQGRRVAEALPDARWVPVAGAGHNDLLARRDVWDEFGAFVRGL